MKKYELFKKGETIMTQKQWTRKFNKAVAKVQKLLELKTEATISISAAGYHYLDEEVIAKDNLDKKQARWV